MPSLEDDYLQRAREYWREYQFYVYVGLAMLLAAITGFTFRHTYSEESRAQVNADLYQLIDSADSGDRAAAEAVYAALQQEAGYEELGYLGAFVLSSLYMTEADTAAVATVLAPVLDSSEDSGIRQLAALRIAEAHIVGGDTAAALDILRDNLPASGRLRVLFTERIGDGEYIAGDTSAALRSYTEAIELAEENASFYRPILAIKRAALLSTPEAARAIKAADEELREVLRAALEERAQEEKALAEEIEAKTETETETETEEKEAETAEEEEEEVEVDAQ